MTVADLSFATSVLANESLAEVAIVLIVMSSHVILSIFHESKDEAKIEALQAMTTTK
jgi:hypothetical protein